MADLLWEIDMFLYLTAPASEQAVLCPPASNAQGEELDIPDVECRQNMEVLQEELSAPSTFEFGEQQLDGAVSFDDELADGISVSEYDFTIDDVDKEMDMAFLPSSPCSCESEVDLHSMNEDSHLSTVEVTSEDDTLSQLMYEDEYTPEVDTMKLHEVPEISPLLPASIIQENGDMTRDRQIRTTPNSIQKRNVQHYRKNPARSSKSDSVIVVPQQEKDIALQQKRAYSYSREWSCDPHEPRRKRPAFDRMSTHHSALLTSLGRCEETEIRKQKTWNAASIHRRRRQVKVGCSGSSTSFLNRNVQCLRIAPVSNAQNSAILASRDGQGRRKENYRTQRLPHTKGAEFRCDGLLNMPITDGVRPLPTVDAAVYETKYEATADGYYFDNARNDDTHGTLPAQMEDGEVIDGDKP